MKTFKLSISTPSGHSFESEDITIINCHLLEGRIGVMAGHTPLISSLKVSSFSIEDKDGKKIRGAIRGGMFEVKDNEVLVLTTNYCFEHETTPSNIDNEIKNVEYQLRGDELTPNERKILENRLKYEQLKKELI